MRNLWPNFKLMLYRKLFSFVITQTLTKSRTKTKFVARAVWNTNPRKENGEANCKTNFFKSISMRSCGIDLDTLERDTRLVGLINLLIECCASPTSTMGLFVYYRPGQFYLGNYKFRY